MDDLISRQAATQTALEFIVEYLGGAFDEDFQRKLIERMNALPSAQPDIIRCNDYKYWTHIKRTNRYWCKTDDGLWTMVLLT